MDGLKLSSVESAVIKWSLLCLSFKKEKKRECAPFIYWHLMGQGERGESGVWWTCINSYWDGLCRFSLSFGAVGIRDS